MWPWGKRDVWPFVRELDAMHDIGSLPRAASFLLDDSEEIRTAAANAIVRLLRGIPPARLTALDEDVRVQWRHQYVDTPKLAADYATEVLGVFSFHPSGYVREAAVRRLAESRDGAELPYLLLRLTDWVPQVREAALRAVQARVSDDSVEAFARNFALVQRARFVVEPFATPRGQAALLAQLRARADRGIARLLLGQNPAAIDACVSSRDPVIRSWAAPLAPLRLVHDPAPGVRYAALRALPLHEARPFLERAVLDTSGSLRELARLLVPADYPAIYRDALHAAATPRKIAVAIAGLSETGTSADAEHIAPYLAHHASSVRRAAVKGGMRLAGDAYAERVSSLLDDPSPAVSAAARNSLRRHAPDLGSAHLRALFANASTLHARQNTLHLLAGLRKWQSITPLLEAVLHDDVAELAKQYVQRWNAAYNRSQVAPSRNELASLTAAFAAAEASLDEATSRDIRFALRSFGL
ncbi:MAG TPA: hypothetical protein VEO54_01140 [Thermoanaerobaculia bacterium]|nr:hypothetical protein [Thermoanaerobaculia bacterium]